MLPPTHQVDLLARGPGGHVLAGEGGRHQIGELVGGAGEHRAAERGEGLLFGGRCLSAEHEAVASARVTAQCFSYGHALGVAATVALRERVALRAIPGAAVRDLLNRQGARLDG